ncbi:hypothetical protein [Enterococcus bulliens]
MKHIIGLDIDEYRVGIVANGYHKVLSASYSSVKKNNWKAVLFRDKLGGDHGKRIQLQDSLNAIDWGINHLYSRRPKAYETFGNVLKNLKEPETHAFIKTILSYLVADKQELFDAKYSNTFACSLCIGVSTKSTDDLAAIEQAFTGEFHTMVDGETYTIIVEDVTMIPRTLCAILEDNHTKVDVDMEEMNFLDGLSYVLDLSDHYLCCDVYEDGEVIKSDYISTGLIALADRVVQEYRTSCLRKGERPFQINSEIVYNLITTAARRSEFVLKVNGQNTIDLTPFVRAEFVEETKKVLSYLKKDNDVQYADSILIRDIQAEVINQKQVDLALETVGLFCKKMDNVCSKGEYLFGEIMWNGQSDLEFATDETVQTKAQELLFESVNEEPSRQAYISDSSSAQLSEQQYDNDQDVDYFAEESSTQAISSDATDDFMTEESSIDLDAILKEQLDVLNELSLNMEDDR